MAAQGSILGNAVTRKEDPGLLTGANAYVDDLDIDSLRIVFVRSTMAHASLLEVDTSEAINMPGVSAIYTCLLYTSPSPRDATLSRMPSSA